MAQRSVDSREWSPTWSQVRDIGQGPTFLLAPAHGRYFFAYALQRRGYQLNAGLLSKRQLRLVCAHATGLAANQNESVHIKHRHHAIISRPTSATVTRSTPPPQGINHASNQENHPNDSGFDANVRPR